MVSTRDCSLQRRHQKLVEEAPAPFLTDDQRDQLYAASKAILREAGYVGAGTCEFLVGQDGTISFLEVNTRLQVEHPVSEEVTGLDLVREMFRVADGEELGYDDPEVRGHSIEFRINAEDAGRGFMPAPGTLTAWRAPAGPGVRVDEGYLAGMTVPGSFDSLVAKVVVSGRDRAEALARSRRALSELVVEGMPTVVPFHRAVLDDPAFTGGRRHLRRAHALDRDRVRGHHRALVGHRGHRGRGRAFQRRRRGERQAARGRRAGRAGSRPRRTRLPGRASRPGVGRLRRRLPPRRATR